jgi:hypothetical protein
LSDADIEGGRLRELAGGVMADPSWSSTVSDAPSP